MCCEGLQGLEELVYFWVPICPKDICCIVHEKKNNLFSGETNGGRHVLSSVSNTGLSTQLRIQYLNNQTSK